MEKYKGDFSADGFVNPKGERIGGHDIHNNTAIKIAEAKYPDRFETYYKQKGYGNDYEENRAQYYMSRTIGSDFLVLCQGYDMFTRRYFHVEDIILTCKKDAYWIYYDLLLCNNNLLIEEHQGLVYDYEKEMFLPNTKPISSAQAQTNYVLKKEINEVRKSRYGTTFL